MIKEDFFKILSLLLFAILITISFLYAKTVFTKEKTKEIDPALQKIRQLMILPSETPQITTIEDVESVRQRDVNFFKNAKVGDRLIAYQYILILFDPEQNKIKNVKTFPSPPPTPAIALKISFRYNGNEKERAENLKNQILPISPNYVITEVIKSKANYKEDVVYLVNKSRQEDAMNFAQAIGGSKIIQELEPNETATDADLIVAFRDIR